MEVREKCQKILNKDNSLTIMLMVKSVIMNINKLYNPTNPGDFPIIRADDNSGF